MLNETIQANNLDIEIFTTAESGDDIEEFQSAINNWLKSQPNNVLIHDIIYKQSGRTQKGRDILSVVILSGTQK